MEILGGRLRMCSKKLKVILCRLRCIRPETTSFVLQPKVAASEFIFFINKNNIWPKKLCSLFVGVIKLWFMFKWVRVFFFFFFAPSVSNMVYVAYNANL